MWIGNIAYFFFSVANPRTYAVGSELLNLGKVLLREIIFYIVCAGVSDIDRCRNGWDNLFRKSSVIKECGDKNLVFSNSDRNILVIKISKK